MKPLHTIDELEDDLSRPAQGVLDTLRAIDGDVMVLGAGGKWGRPWREWCGGAWMRLGRSSGE